MPSWRSKKSIRPLILFSTYFVTTTKLWQAIFWHQNQARKFHCGIFLYGNLDIFGQTACGIHYAYFSRTFDKIKGGFSCFARKVLQELQNQNLQGGFSACFGETSTLLENYAKVHAI
jgi:hypothetical protein